MRPLLPYALSFAAGAMIFVVIEELIPPRRVGLQVFDCPEPNTEEEYAQTLLDALRDCCTKKWPAPERAAAVRQSFVFPTLGKIKPENARV